MTAELGARLALWQERVLSVLGELGIDAPSVDADLFEGGELDSVTFAEMLLRFETRFGSTFRLNDLDVDHFRSVRRMAEWLSTPVTVRVRRKAKSK